MIKIQKKKDDGKKRRKQGEEATTGWSICTKVLNISEAKEGNEHEKDRQKRIAFSLMSISGCTSSSFSSRAFLFHTVIDKKKKGKQSNNNRHGNNPLSEV